MGKRSDYFTKSSYFSADETAGQSLKLVISEVEDVEFQNDNGKPVTKPVLTFRGHDKKLVVGAMNYDRLADVFGDETQNWVGCTVTLTGEKVTFRNKRVNSIIARPVPSPKVAAKQQEEEEPPFDDEIPNMGSAA